MSTEMRLYQYHRIELLRVVIGILFVLYIFSAWRENIHLAERLQGVQNSLRILHQMQSYAQEACSRKKVIIKPSAYVEKGMKQIRLAKRQGITSKTINDELSFILMAPTLQCIAGQVFWLRQRYKEAKIIVTIDLTFTVLNQESIPEGTTKPFYFLGGFSNRSAAMNRAIEIVSTKYFIIIDHTVDLANMSGNFVEVLLSNMPGFDVLSGAEMVGANREFRIPCHRLRLKNWSLFETYEYIASGNVLRCDSTSLFFVGRTETFNHPYHKNLFDINLPSKWLQDLFIRLQGVLEVGVLPEVIIHRLIADYKCYYYVVPKKLSSMERVDLLLPFANKYQIFFLDNGTSRQNVCKNSGKLICSEQDISQKWSIGKLSSTGLTTFPFIIESLQKALHFGEKCLKESHLLYVIEGGTLLGLVKVRDILPWDHGDIDTFVYSTRRNVMNMVMKSHREHGFSYWLRFSGFHTYVSHDPNSFNGCIVYLTRRVRPKGIIYMRHNDKLFPIKRGVFAFLRQLYGSLYFENHMKYTNERNYCKIHGHHACMPDCRWHGCGGGPSAYPGIL